MKQYNQEDFENQHKDLVERLKQQKISPWDRMMAEKYRIMAEQRQKEFDAMPEGKSHSKWQKSNYGSNLAIPTQEFTDCCSSIDTNWNLWKINKNIIFSNIWIIN